LTNYTVYLTKIRHYISELFCWYTITSFTTIIIMKIFHHSLPLFIGSLWIIWWLFSHDKSYTNYVENLTHMRVQIMNSYSGSIARSTGQNIIESGGILRTNQDNLMIRVSASTWSSFTFQWDVITDTGTGINTYNIDFPITITSWDQHKDIQALFMRSDEPYMSNSLSIQKDSVWPSSFFLVWPVANTVINNGIIITLSRWSVYDNGIWLSYYKIHLSLDPWFIGETTFTTTGTTIDLADTSLPQGTIFWYVEAIDFLGNSTSTLPTFFHHWSYSKIPTDQSWRASGWGWYSSWTDNSISWNNTNSWTLWNSTWNHSSLMIIDNNNPPMWISNWLNTSSYTPSIPLSTILIKNYENLPLSVQWMIKLPHQYKTGDDKNITNIREVPDARLYENLITNHYLWYKPLWYTVNIISRIIVLFYYMIKGLEIFYTKFLYFIFKKKHLN